MNIGTKGKTRPEPMEGTCEEASIYSTNAYIACGNKSTKAVYHKRDDATYRMCDMCAYHNIHNRGGELVA